MRAPESIQPTWHCRSIRRLRRLAATTAYNGNVTAGNGRHGRVDYCCASSGWMGASLRVPEKAPCYALGGLGGYACACDVEELQACPWL
jgi:hypothetical protein